MKKIKRLFSSAKNNSDNASFRGSLGKRNSSLSSIAGQSLNYDIKPKDLDKIHKAVLNQDEKKVELLAPKYVNTRDKGDRTPLHLACAIGNVAIVEKLLSWKALINVPDRENKTPLFKAIECGHEDCAKLLIQTKVGLTVYDKDGNSCLHHLCIHGMTPLIPLVLDKLTVADSDKKNKFGQNPLHLAIEKNNAQATEMLLKKGVSPNTYNQNNITPLMMACYRGHKDIVLRLLRHEADPSMKDSNGNTAADLAMKMGHEDCVKEIEYFHENDVNAEASNLNGEEEEAVTKDKSSRTMRTAEAKEVKQMNEEEENEEDASWEESEAEGNDFYKGKANLMLSKILKEDHPSGGAVGGDPDIGVQLTIADKMTKNMLMDCHDEEEDVDEEVTPLSETEKLKEIPALKDQMQFLSQLGDMNDIISSTAVVHDQPPNVVTSTRSKQTHQEDDESCWDSSCEDTPDNILNEQPPEGYFKDEKGLQSQNGTFSLSEIKYPIVTEKFHLNSQSQNDKQHTPSSKTLPEPVKKSKDDSFPESSDEEVAQFPTLKQNKGRRSSSIENQIGTFIKNSDLSMKNSVKEEKEIRKSFVSDWDSVSEKSSHTSDHSVKELKNPNENFIPTSITESPNAMKHIKTVDLASMNSISYVREGISETTEDLRALKVEVTSLKEILSTKDAEVEKLKRDLKILEEENVELKTKPTKVDGDDSIKSKETGLLKEEADNLQKELDKMRNKNTELQELNNDLRTKLNIGNKSLDQATQSHKIEVSTLKKELTDLENKLKEHQQTKQLESSNEAEMRMNLKKLEEQLKYQMDACKEHEMQLTEKKSKIMNLELDNNHLKMTLDGKTNRCNELEKEVNKLTSKHEDVMRELLAEKDKSIKTSIKSETQQERIDALLKELENMRGMNHSISSSSEILLKAEYEQKVSLFEELNEDMKRTVSKLREELDLQRKKHEDEYKTLTFAKNELFNKLVLAESSLKKESISKQFLESELQQLTKDSQAMKQKLSEEQHQRQAVELKMISMNQSVEASKSSSITIESKLNQKSEALTNVEKENEFLKSSLHKIELEKVKLDASLKMEQQQKENLQEELIDLKNKLTESLRESFEHHRVKKHLQEKVQDLAGSKDMAVMEAENHREMWENEIKSKSKLGLRLFQLDHENRSVLTKLTQEQMKLRKALEKNHFLTEELQMEKHRGNILSQKLDEFNKISSTRSKDKIKYNHSRYLIDTSCKKCKKTKDTEERIYSKDIMKEAERMKREIEQKTQTEFMEKLQQVYQFLEEQTIIRSQNEQKRMENLELYRNNLFNSSDQLAPPFHKAFGLSDKPNKIQALFDELKLSENKLREHLGSNNEAFRSENSVSIHPTIPKGYSTEDILQQLEKSIKTCSSTI